jgi:hypothetical protein
MPEDKASDQRIRKNIMMSARAVAIAKEMIQDRHLGQNKFSQFLTDLVLDAHKRQTSGGDKSLEQYLIQIVDLLEKNKALEARLKEKMEGFKLERKSLVEALHLCEEDLKQARGGRQ